MMRASAKTKSSRARGMALLLTLFALLLLSGIGLFMVLSSNTETRIDANYGSSLHAYYGARSGLEEVRDRISYASPAVAGGKVGGLADLLPQDIAGNADGVLYILNPANGETVDPTDLANVYFDDDLCHAYNSGTPKGIKCASVPTTPNWVTTQASQVPSTGRPLGYKWVRINMKTNRIADPYFVDLTGTSAPVDTRVCWDGQAEQLLPAGGNPTCDANGMQTVYMLTAMAMLSHGTGVNGARKLLQSEIVAPSIRPAGALTAASMNLATVSNAGIPPVAIDGRVHNLDGSLLLDSSHNPTSKNGCSSIAPVATNSGTAQMEQMLDTIRMNIVNTANASCNADGTPVNTCTPGLWWVRGTNLSPRFVTSVTTSGSTSGGSGTSGSGDGGHDGGGSGSDGGNTYRTPTGISTSLCDSTNPSCYTNLDLAAPELFATAATSGVNVPTVTLPTNAPAPFVGNSGNQADATIYQPPQPQTVANQIAAINNLVTAVHGTGNYFAVSAAMLGTGANSYGTQAAPAVVVTDATTTLALQSGANLSGYGVLVVPTSLEINSGATLSWNGIVLVSSATGHVTVTSGANGYINGALLLAPGAVFNFSNTTSAAPSFQILYSCDSIDLSFKGLPFRVVSTAETSY